MSDVKLLAAALLDHVLMAPQSGPRRLIALAGPPGSGKSSLSKALSERMIQAGCATVVVPMDGFHLPNERLEDLGLLDRKGAPETFDVTACLSLVQSLRTSNQVSFPGFDRSKDAVVSDFGVVSESCDTVIVEGNYLLYKSAGWQKLMDLWDFSIMLDVPVKELETRLLNRWLNQGLSKQQAEHKVKTNDLKNAELVFGNSYEGSITV